MKSFVKMFFIFLLALPLVGQANHSWGGYHWARLPNPDPTKNQFQFTLKVGDNLTTTEWSDLLKKAIIDWSSPHAPPSCENALASFNFFPVPAPTTPVLLNRVTGTSKKNCSMVSGTTQICNGGYGKNGWLGLATINITSPNHITQGSAKMNDSYFSMAKYNNLYEKQHVVCQEMAHTFGLDHQSEDGSSQNSCMDYFSNTGVLNEKSRCSTEPNYHDFVELNDIYNHTDSFSSYSSTSSPVLAMGAEPVDHNDQNSWGQLVSQSHNGRGSIYERITGPSSKSITHVYWTEEAVGDCPSCDHRYHRFE